MKKRGHPWTEQELKYLKRYYPIYGEDHCAKKLQRTTESVRKKANAQDITSGIPIGHVPLLWVTRPKCNNIPPAVIQRAREEGALSDLPGRNYRYTVRADWADKFEEEQRQLDKMDRDRQDWLTRKQIAYEANITGKSLIRQIQDNRHLGKALNEIEHYQMRGSGRPWKYHPIQAREAIANYRKTKKYDFNRSQNILKVLQETPNLTIKQIAEKLRTKPNTIYSTVRNLQRKKLVTRTRATSGTRTMREYRYKLK